MTCPIFQVADLVGKKWTIVIIQEVALNGERGFNHILRRMGKISPKLLSGRLKELEEKGILKKSIIADSIPVKTSYRLTKKGRDLQDLIDLLKAWHSKYDPDFDASCSQECVSCTLY